MKTDALTLNSNIAPAKRMRRKEARPGELLDAALALFVEKGFAATRVEEVAMRSGVSKGTLFLYFNSKEELFKAVVRHHLSGHFPQWNSEFEAFKGSSADMLHHCMQAWWQRIGATPVAGISKLMLSEARNFPELADFYCREVIEPGQDLIKRILQRGIERGEFGELDLNYAVYSVLAPLMFLVTWKYAYGASLASAGQLHPETYITQQAEIILHGLCSDKTARTKKGNS